MYLFTKQQKEQAQKYLQLLQEAYANGEVSADEDDIYSLYVFMEEEFNKNVDYNWLEIVIAYLHDLAQVETYSNDSDYLAFMEGIKTKMEELDAAIKEANDLKVSPEITEKKLTDISTITNSVLYNVARSKMRNSPTDTQTVQQEIFNRGFTSLDKFGGETAANRYGSYELLDDYLNSLI